MLFRFGSSVNRPKVRSKNSRINLHYQCLEPRQMLADVMASGISHHNGNVTFTADSIGSSYRLRQSAYDIHTLRLTNYFDFDSAVDFINSTSDFSNEFFRSGVQAHYGLEKILEYFDAELGRDSYDDLGSRVTNIVGLNGDANAQGDHPGKIPFWIGDGRLGVYSSSGTEGSTLDLLTHAFVHGIVESTAQFEENGEPRALAESFGDIFGEAVENYATGANDWLFGDGVPNFFGPAFRSLVSPNDYRDPASYLGQYWFNDYEGGWEGGETNSGVQNKWFHILSEGESGVNEFGYSYDVTGIGISDAAKIAFRNLTVYLEADSDYEDSRVGAEQAAIDLFGPGSQQHLSTIEAWEAVNVWHSSQLKFRDFSGLISAESFGLGTKVVESFTPGDQRLYSFELEAGQNLAVRVAGQDGLNPDVTLSWPDGTVYSSDGAVDTYLNQNMPSTIAGQYELLVKASGIGQAEFEVGALLNAMFETKVANDSFETAQPLLETFSPSSLGTSLESNAGLLHVSGRLYGESIYSEHFESGEIGSEWEVNNSSVKVSELYPEAGYFSLSMINEVRDSLNSRKEAVLTVDLSTSSTPVLSYAVRAWDFDEMPATFSGSANADGVAISSDGINWFRIESEYPGRDVLMLKEIDLKQAAIEHGLTLGAGFKIKFQQYGPNKLPFDGRVYDSINIVERDVPLADGVDWYSFAVTEKEEVSLYANRHQESKYGPTQVALHDSNGVLLESGQLAGFDQKVIDSRIDRMQLTPGIYYAKVTSGTARDYSLVVAREMLLEMNSDGYPSFRWTELDGTRGVTGELIGFSDLELDPDEAENDQALTNFFPGVEFRDNARFPSQYSVVASDFSDEFEAPTGSKVFSYEYISPRWNWREGFHELRANFDVGQHIVSITVGAATTETAVGFLSAFAADGTLLMRATTDELLAGETETLSVFSEEREIAYIVASGIASDVALDNLKLEDKGVPEWDRYAINLSLRERIQVALVFPETDGAQFGSQLTQENSILELRNDFGLVASGTSIDYVVDTFAHDHYIYVRPVGTEPIHGNYFLELETTGGGFIIDEHRLIYYGTDFGGWNTATDIEPLRNGETATFQNYSTNEQGINGFYVQGVNFPVFESGAAFWGSLSFKVGTTDDTSTWEAAPFAVAGNVATGAGPAGEDRLWILWEDNLITNTWLQVTIIANEHTGLPQDEVFYFGNVIGDTGNDPNNANVNLQDVALVRQNQTGFGTADIENDYDVNRDGRVNLVDIAIVRANQSGFSPVPLITPNDGTEGRSEFSEPPPIIGNKKFRSKNIGGFGLAEFDSSDGLLQGGKSQWDKSSGQRIAWPFAIPGIGQSSKLSRFAASSPIVGLENGDKVLGRQFEGFNLAPPTSFGFLNKSTSEFVGQSRYLLEQIDNFSIHVPVGNYLFLLSEQSTQSLRFINQTERDNVFALLEKEGKLNSELAELFAFIEACLP